MQSQCVIINNYDLKRQVKHEFQILCRIPPRPLNSHLILTFYMESIPVQRC